MSHFEERYRNWHGSAEAPASPMFQDSAQPVAEPSKRVPVERANVTDVLERIERTLEAMLAATERGNSTTREGAVSSCEIKFLAPTKDHPEGKPQPVIKAYADSPVPVDMAIEAYGRAVLMAQQAALEGWEQTLAVLQAERAARQP